MPAASPLKKFMTWLNAEEVDEEYVTDMETPTASSHEPTAAPKRPKGNLMLHPNGDGGLEIRHPRTLEDRMIVGADLKQRRMVTLDLTRLPDGEARYFLEFVYGVVFALDATAEKVTEGIYLLAPRGISVRNDTEEPLVKPFSPSRSSGTGRGEQEEMFWQAR